MQDPRLFAPAVLRNRDALVAVLRDVLPRRGLVLEIGSGSGEHALYFSQNFPNLTFQPSDLAQAARDSADAWAQKKRRFNMRPAMALDARSTPRPICTADAILGLDFCHATPWSATEGLFFQAYDLLQPGAPLFLYGPFLRSERAPSQGLSAFDARLRAQDPEWGLRDLDAVTEIARANDFFGLKIFEMGDERLGLMFRRG